MEHILGFTRSHWMLPLGKSLGGIAPVAAMVEKIDCKHNNTNKTQLFACDYHTLFASNANNFWGLKWALYSRH
jgi:hypothetical protein